MSRVFFLLLLSLSFGIFSCFNKKALYQGEYSFVENGNSERSEIKSRNDQLKNTESIVWTWRFIGPDSKPIENKNAGKSLPSYSFDRGNGAGKIHRIYINPNNHNQVFACSGIGGLFVSEDKGIHWHLAGTDKLPVSGVGSVTVSSKDSNLWAISTGDPDDTYTFSDGIWLTRDAGEHWVNINGKNPLTRFPVSEELEDLTYVAKIVSDPKDFNKIFVACNKGLFVTENAMANNPADVSWRQIDDSFYFDIEIPTWNNDEVFASGNSMVRSEDGGKTWIQLPLPTYENSGKYPFLRISMEMTAADKNHIYAAVTNNEKHTHCKQGKASFQKFSLDSLKWEEVRSLSRGMNNVIPTRGAAFEVSPVDSSLIFAANVQPIYRSTDGGKSFSGIKRMQMHDDIHHIEFSPDGKVLWAGHDGGVSVSFDKGITWENRDDGIGCAMVYKLAVAQQVDPVYLFGGFDIGGILYKNNQWSHVLWGDGFKSLINFHDADTMFVSRQNGFVFRSDDGGKTWNRSVKPRGTKTPWYTWVVMNTHNPQTIYTAGKKLGRSFDSGEHWDFIFDAAIHQKLANGDRIFLSESNPDLMYMNYFKADDYQDPQVYRSFNINEEIADSVRWQKINYLPLKGRIVSIVPDDINPFQFWLAYRDHHEKGGVFFFDGEHWNNYGKELGNANIHSLILENNNNGRIYLGTTFGVFTRDRDDTKWTLLRGLPGTYIRSMDINYVTNKIIIGTDGRGLWEGDLFRE